MPGKFHHRQSTATSAALQKQRTPGLGSMRTTQTPASQHSLESADMEGLNRLFGQVVPQAALFRQDLVHHGASKSLFDEVEEFISQSPHLSHDQVARLHLTVSVYNLVNANIELAQSIIGDRNISSIRDAALDYYGRLDAHMDPKSARIVKIHLFEAESTAVLLNLIKSGKISVPKDLEPAVIKVLSALAPTFDISKQSMRGILEDATILTQLPKQDRPAVVTWLKTLQRLQALVRLPEDVDLLMKAEFTSAESIAATPITTFQDIMDRVGLDADSSRRIHDHAVTVHLRNEHAWTAFLQSRSQFDFGGIQGLSPKSRPSARAQLMRNAKPRTVGSSNISKQVNANTSADDPINFETLFGDIDSTPCEECSSVLGLSAYFVDLLRMLKNSFVDKTKTTSLLDKLLERRPDLVDLQLSCSNTNTLIPYIDLVNEIMEAFVRFLGGASPSGPIVIPAYNTDDLETSEDQIAQPFNVQYSVYKDFILKQMSPIHIFPYDQSKDSIRSYLDMLGSSRYELMTTFRSAIRLAFHATSGNTALVTEELLEEVTLRAEAAEYLRLLQSDFIAISKESFWSTDAVRALTSNPNLTLAQYQAAIGLQSTAFSWGYNDLQNGDALMNDITNGTGLAFVEKQFLPRSGLLFVDLVQVLKSQYLDGTIELTSKSTSAGNPTKSGISVQLSDLRLSSTTMTPLTSSNWDVMASFIRIRNKLGWSVADTDDALVVLGIKPGQVLGPECIKQLAAIRQIAAFTSIDISRLLPIWGDISTRGDTSLYSRIFLRQRLTGRDPVFVLDASGQIQAGAKFSTHMPVVLAALGLSPQSFAGIQEFYNVGDDLTIANISIFYRIALISAILGISPTQFETLSAMFTRGSANTNVLASPSQTMSFLKVWNSLSASGWIFSQVLFVVKGTDNMQDQFTPPLDAIVKTSAAIITGLQSIETAYQDYASTPDRASTDEVAKISTLLFGSGSSQALTQFVDGTMQVSVQFIFPAPNAPEISPADLPSQVKYRRPGRGTLVLTGVLSSSDLESLKSKSDNPAWKAAIQKLDDLSKDPFQTYLSNLFNATDRDIFFSVPGTDGGPPPQNPISAERRLLYLEGILPGLKNSLKRQLVLDSVVVDFSGLDNLLLQTLLSNIIEVLSTDDTTKIPAMSALQTVTDLNVIPSTAFQGYFLPDLTDSYQFIFPARDGDTQPDFTVNDVAASFTRSGQTWVSMEINFTKGQYSHLHYTGDLSKVQVRSRQIPTAFVDRQMVLSNVVVDSITIIYKMVATVGVIVAQFQLTKDDISYLHSPGLNGKTIDFTNASVADIQRLKLYSDLSHRSSQNGSPLKLLDLFKWVSRPENQADAQYDSFTNDLALITSLTKATVVNFLGASYTGITKPGLIKLFQDEIALFKMFNIMDRVKQYNLSGLTMETLFSLAEPELYTGNPRGFDDAATLRQLMRSNATQGQGETALTASNDRIRKNQRQVLINYLLQQSFVQSRQLYDADSLFEFFLIDVQMGACLQTSRMKQAVSTVQLFVQRCLLNLELKDHGISSAAVDKARWAWIQRYRVWEASRQIFLYPENWIDPTLRDNKTEVFSALETTLTQNELNTTNIANAVKEYIFGADSTADLDAQAYQWDLVDDSLQQFHIFARTKTAPYKYYYRRMDLREAYNTWNPWQSVSVDVLSYSVDADGKVLPQAGSYLLPAILNGRLYLFLPQITLKSVPIPLADDDKPMQSWAQGTSVNAAKARVQRSWEVKMAWSEYQNGRWSPKLVSDAALAVQGLDLADFPEYEPADQDKPLIDAGQKFPDIASFRFWIRSRTTSVDSGFTTSDSILIIDAERWIPGLNDFPAVNIPLGRFEMRNQQMVIAKRRDVELPYRTLFTTTLPSVFGKLSMDRDNGNAPFVLTGNMTHGKISKSPLLASIEKSGIPIDTRRTITWTMSYDDSHIDTPTGLITDLSGPTAQGSQCWFSLPPLGDISTFDSTIFYHLTSPLFMKATKQTEDASADLDDIYETLPSPALREAYSPIFGIFTNGAVYSEIAAPYALYNWELGVHVISLLMERLLATQQFDLGIQLARYVFNPTAPGSDLKRCWLFPPFQDNKTVTAGSLDSIMASLTPSSGSDSGMNPAILQWKLHPFSPHVVARGRPAAYMKRFVMKYIELLIAYGDSYFRQNSLELIPLAIQCYVEASHTFGPAPQQIPQVGKVAVQTYRQLSSQLDDFSNALVDLELDFPFFTPLQNRGHNTAKAGSSAIMGIVSTEYFCVPANPQLMALRSLIDDRLFKIRNCQDIDGNTLHLALFDPPIDPGLLAQSVLSGLSPSALLSDLDSPLPNYRFYYLLQKAMELCDQLKQLGASLLSVRERKDGEALSILQARHDNAIQQSILDMKKLQRSEIQKSIEQLQEARRSPRLRLAYYLALAGETPQVLGPDDDYIEIQQKFDSITTDDLRMTPNEVTALAQADHASDLTTRAATLEITASDLLVIPGLSLNFQPVGMGYTVSSVDASKLAQGLLCIATGSKMYAQQALDAGARASKVGGFVSQLQDRRFQANLAGREVKSIDKQIAIEKARLATMSSDIAMQQKQIANAAEVEAFLRTKYTSTQLYTWMDNSVRNLFYQTYLIANDLAKKAQRAYRFEQGTDDANFIQPSGYWDAGRDGLLSAEGLYLGLKSLESAYMTGASYDFEITKHVSLRQISPSALLSLRANGQAHFDLSEVLYDFDYPGQYNRRIKSVSVSIPCIVGPYVSTNCTLTLNQHNYRISGSAAGDYPEGDDSDSRFRTDRIPNSAVALSSGQQDAGVFELNFNGERYQPFEGAGAISKWRIEFPSVYPAFDYNSISDVIMHVRYTASNGGAALRKAATAYVKSYMSAVDTLGAQQGLFALFDLKNDYANGWYSFAVAPADPTARTLSLSGIKVRLPFYAQRMNVVVWNISVLVAVDAQSRITAQKMTMHTTSSQDLNIDSNSSVKDLTVFTSDRVSTPLVGDWTLSFNDVNGAKLKLERGFLIFRYTVTS